MTTPTPAPAPGELPRDARFHTTSWTVVVEAGAQPNTDADHAMAMLIERYWFPLYAYAKRKGADPEFARDLVQSFFTHVLEKRSVAAADPERGRFRTFLLTCFDHFAANEHAKATAAKRGAGVAPLSFDFAEADTRTSIEPADSRTPEREFERRWAHAVLDRALARVADELAGGGRRDEFETLRPFLTGDAARGDAKEAAARLGKSAGAFKVAVHRLRKRYGEALREEVRATVTADEDLDDEIDRLFDALREDDA